MQPLTRLEPHLPTPLRPNWLVISGVPDLNFHRLTRTHKHIYIKSVCIILSSFGTRKQHFPYLAIPPSHPHRTLRRPIFWHSCLQLARLKSACYLFLQPHPFPPILPVHAPSPTSILLDRSRRWLAGRDLIPLRLLQLAHLKSFYHRVFQFLHLPGFRGFNLICILYLGQ